jgi:hypothetical protein
MVSTVELSRSLKLLPRGNRVKAHAYCRCNSRERPLGLLLPAINRIQQFHKDRCRSRGLSTHQIRIFQIKVYLCNTQSGLTRRYRLKRRDIDRRQNLLPPRPSEDQKYELSIIRRETTVAAQNQYNESETIPICLFLSWFDLTFTFKDVNKRFS